MTDSVDGNPKPSRRRVLEGLAVGGAALVGGAVAGGAAAHAAGPETSQGSQPAAFHQARLVIEVAVLGDTWRDSPVRNSADPGDLRGMPFSVEGWIYPEGTIRAEGFSPTPEGAIGNWFCCGHLLVHSQRPEPHVTSTQEYLLGLIDAGAPFPADALTTSGLEGTSQPTSVATRAVVGGTGRYAGSFGEVRQSLLGANTSVLANGLSTPASNFRFDFALCNPA